MFFRNKIPGVPLFLLAAAALPCAASGVELEDDETPVLTQPSAPARLDSTARDRAAIATFGENDIGWGDKYYTSGLRLVYTTPEIFTEGIPMFWRDLLTLTPLASSTADAPASYRLHFAASYEFYTPKRRTWRNPPPGEHPYAGLLYGVFGVSSETENRLDSLEFGLGLIGPSARARQSQNSWHRVVDSPLVQGWREQLRDEPLVQFAWTRVWRFNWARSENFSLEWLPRVRAEAGTVRDYALAGWQWRAGWDLPKDFGTGTLFSTTALVRPARDSGRARSGFLPDSLWFFFDAQAELWALNSPLDGSNWHGSRRVHSYPWVGQFSVGVAAQWGAWRLSLTEVVRTKEFRGQDHEVFPYTSLSLHVTF